MSNNTCKFKLISILAIILVSFTFISCSKKADQKQPNIIMFMVDDMGWQDTSLPFWKEKTEFNRRYHTPNMEKLAAQGMMFTQAYATPVCSPTRISLMSGMNAARHRVTNWTLRRNASVDAKHKILGYPEWNVNGIQPSDSIENAVHATMLPQILKDNGYFTIHCGKAHFGAIGTPTDDPINCGFDVNIAGHAAGGPGSFYGHKNFGNKEKGGHTLPWGIPGLEKYHGDSIYLTEALTIEAKAALDKSMEADKPFYLYMSHYAVHVPIMADERFMPRYEDMDIPKVEKAYATMVEGMDKSLGDLMIYLEEKGIAENTIVIFMSDNGGYSLQARGGKPHTHNKPLNSGKGSMYEGGIREPMIVKWPGKVKAGTKNSEYLIIEDFFPSILEMAGVEEYSAVQTIDGKSFIPMLTENGTSAEGRNLYWHFPNNWGPTGPGIGATSTIRSGDWKLIYYYRDSSFELFNIVDDIGELNNLSKSKPEKVKQLAKELGTYLKSVEAQRPHYKETGELVPFPDEVI